MKVLTELTVVEGRLPIARRNTVSAAMKVLDALAVLVDNSVAGLDEVAVAAGVSSTTAYRLLSTLEAAGLAERLPGGGYRAGARALEWAGNLLARLDVRNAALPVLRSMGALPGETVLLALLREAGLTAVEILPVDAVLPLPANPVGVNSTVPVHASALGRAVAVHLEPGRLARLLGPEPYRRYTDKTVTTWRGLSARLDEARARGFAFAADEVTDGVTGVAASVFSGDEVVGSVSIAARSDAWDQARIDAAGRIVVSAAATISGRLGRPGHPAEAGRPRAAGEP